MQENHDCSTELTDNVVMQVDLQNMIQGTKGWQLNAEYTFHLIIHDTRYIPQTWKYFAYNTVPNDNIC